MLNDPFCNQKLAKNFMEGIGRYNNALTDCCPGASALLCFQQQYCVLSVMELLKQLSINVLWPYFREARATALIYAI